MFFRKGIEHNRNNSWGHLGLAAALVELNGLEEAKAALQEGLALDRNFDMRNLSANLAAISPTALEGRKRFIDALRIAGMPKG